MGAGGWKMDKWMSETPLNIDLAGRDLGVELKMKMRGTEL